MNFFKNILDRASVHAHMQERWKFWGDFCNVLWPENGSATRSGKSSMRLSVFTAGYKGLGNIQWHLICDARPWKKGLGDKNWGTLQWRI